VKTALALRTGEETQSKSEQMKVHTPVLAAALIGWSSLAHAQVELSFYGGIQSALDSDVTIRDDDAIANQSFNQAWDGRSFEAPIYYGLRVTRWQDSAFGYGLEFNHAKVYPRNDELPAGFERLELTDGINTLTANAYYRWDSLLGEVTPYVGGGLGLAIPHVEVITEESRTFGYQVTGPAATFIAGARMPIADRWSVFGEYKGTFSSNEADLDTGGTFEADIVTNAINVGVSFDF